MENAYNLSEEQTIAAIESAAKVAAATLGALFGRTDTTWQETAVVANTTSGVFEAALHSALSAARAARTFE